MYISGTDPLANVPDDNPRRAINRHEGVIIITPKLGGTKHSIEFLPLPKVERRRSGNQKHARQLN